MTKPTVTLDIPHRHLDTDFTADWLTVRANGETVVLNYAGEGSLSAYTLGTETTNPRVIAQADAILYEGFVGLTHYKNRVVTISHHYTGVEDRLPVDEHLDRPVQTLEKTELVELEGDKFPERLQYTCSDCGKEVDREPHQMDIPGITAQRCTSCTMDKMGGRK